MKLVNRGSTVLGKYLRSSIFPFLLLFNILHRLLDFLLVYFGYKFTVDSVGNHFSSTLHIHIIHISLLPKLINSIACTETLYFVKYTLYQKRVLDNTNRHENLLCRPNLL
jgi:hypothetical protein